MSATIADQARYVGGYEEDRPFLRYVDRQRSSESIEPPNRHSPNGFAWGYTGNGPADTALAIVQHAVTRLGHFQPAAADRVYQDFKRGFVAKLGLNQPFEIAAADVDHWLQQRGIVQARPPGSRVAAADLSALPVRDQLLRMRESESPSWREVALRSGLDANVVRNIVNWSATTISSADAAEFCERLRLDPSMMWAPATVANVPELAVAKWPINRNATYSLTITGAEVANPAPTQQAPLGVELS